MMAADETEARGEYEAALMARIADLEREVQTWRSAFAGQWQYAHGRLCIVRQLDRKKPKANKV